MFSWFYLFPCLSSGELSISDFWKCPPGGGGGGGGGSGWLGLNPNRFFLKIQNGGYPESFPTRKLLYLNSVLSLKNKLTKRITILELLIHNRHQTMLNPPKISEKPPKENRALPIEQVFTLQILYNGRIYSNIVFKYYIM